uniref:Uncharacterized protein n=1 Tax=Manihot esculenta TaxID=3983 RepID=A0A2C9VZW7_MANES
MSLTFLVGNLCLKYFMDAISTWISGALITLLTTCSIC